MADQADEPEVDEATWAFQELTREVADVRAELSVMRRAVEGIGPALSGVQPPDYTPTLGQIAASQQASAAALGKIEQHPALQVTPEAYACRTASAIEQAVRGPLRDAEHTAQAVRGSARDLQAMLGSARSRQAQNGRLAQAAAIGAVLGLVLFLLVGFPLARALPFGSLPDTLAASALGENRWNAGMDLMKRADPPRWNALVEGYQRAESAGDELRACYEALRRTGKEQKCTVTLKPAPQAGR